MWLCVNGASAESKARGEQVNATALFNTVCVRYAVNISAICLPMNTHTPTHTHNKAGNSTHHSMNYGQDNNKRLHV